MKLTHLVIGANPGHLSLAGHAWVHCKMAMVRELHPYMYMSALIWSLLSNGYLLLMSFHASWTIDVCLYCHDSYKRFKTTLQTYRYMMHSFSGIPSLIEFMLLNNFRTLMKIKKNVEKEKKRKDYLFHLIKSLKYVIIHFCSLAWIVRCTGPEGPFAET